jgi:hypothetical protein
MAVTAVEALGAAAVSIARVALTALIGAIFTGGVDPGLLGVEARAAILEIASAVREVGVLAAICPATARLGTVIVGSACMLVGCMLEDRE